MEKETKGFEIKRGSDIPLGVSFQNNVFNFAVSMPGSSSCNLVLYKKGETVPAEVIPMEASALGVFSIGVKLAEKHGYTGYEYLYQTEDAYVCDPYAAKINGRELFGEEPDYIRAEVFVPSGLQTAQHKRQKLSELVVYKLHVRGFTMGKGSGARKKGTYAGVMEKIPYMKELGINAVLLMPVVEFDELEAEHKTNSSVVIGAPKRAYHGQQKPLNGHGKEAVLQKDVDNCRQKVNYWGYAAPALSLIHI